MLSVIKDYLRTKPSLSPYYNVLKGYKNGVREHLANLRFLIGMVIPIILSTGKRPVLFFRYVGMGDIICSFPAAERLKEKHPGHSFIYSCYPEFVCLPRLAGITSEVVSLRIDILKKLYSFLFAGIYEFWHVDERLSTDLLPTIDKVSLIEEFALQNHVSVDANHPRLQVGGDVLARVKSFLGKEARRQGPLIVIHCGPSWRVREFPHESWLALISGLRQRGFTNIVQLGTSSHSCMGPVPSMVFPDIISMTDRLTLEESVAIMSMSELFIGIDSGLLHVATSLRIPAIGIFGATSPQNRFSETSSCRFVISDVECQGCHHRQPRLHWESGCPFDVKCMLSIPVERVLEQCLSVLNSVKN